MLIMKAGSVSRAEGSRAPGWERCCMLRSTRSLCGPYGLSPLQPPRKNTDSDYAVNLAALQLQEGWVIHLPVSRNQKNGK